MKTLIPLCIGIVLIELVFIAFSWKLTYFSNPYLVINADNLMSAQVARNIIEGEGYKTNSLSLYEVALYDRKGWLSEGAPWKNTYRFPLPILSMAALFKVFGDSHFVANFLYPSIFHLLSVLGLFVLTYLLFQNGIIAFIASFIFITNNGLLFTMLNKNESADIFFFVISLIVFFIWDRSQKISTLFALGFILGLSFLNRFNEGAILFLVYMIIYLRKRFVMKEFLSYIIGFTIPILPFIFYNLITLGTFFFSSNSYFQFIDNSIISKYMNPWWKLNYSIDVEKPFSYFLLYPSDFLMKSLTYMFKYTIPEILIFRDSIWWWVPLIYVFIRRPLDEKIKTLWMIFLIIFGLHIFLISPLGLNIRYLQFLFVALIIMISKAVYEWYEPTTKFLLNVVSRNKNLVFRKGELIEFSFLLLSLLIILISLYGKFSLKIYTLIIVLILTLLIISIIKKNMLIITISSALILLFSSALWLENRYKMFDIKALTAEEPAVLKKIEDTTSTHSIILATHFWNPVWFSKRTTIPIPEYPDEIYLLMKKYNLNIVAIYFSNMDIFLRHANPRTPISYYAYARLTEKNLPIKGFTQIEPLVKGSLLLYRDNDKLEDILNTDKIDFGEIDSNSHLIYGFSPPMTFDNSSVCWVIRDSGSIPFDRQKFKFFKNRKLLEYDNPNAEITFLWDGKKPLKEMRIKLLNFNRSETMTIVLNSNLFSYGDKGFLMETNPLHDGWNEIRLPVRENHLKVGLNKLSLWFKEKRNISDFAIHLKDLPDQDRNFIAIAFDKIEFFYESTPPVSP